MHKVALRLPTEPRPLKPHELTELRRLDGDKEQWRWLLIVDGHEREGCVSPVRANELRALVLRGESITAEPLDDTPQTRRWAQERRRVSLAVAATAAQHFRRTAGNVVSRQAQPVTAARGRAARSARRSTPRSSHGPPGRQADDDPHERPLARLARLRALVDAHLYPSRVWAEIARGLERERQL